VVPDSNRAAGIMSTPAAQAAPSSVAPAARPVALEQPAFVRTVYVSPASHGLGLGALMGGSPVGFGVTARAWRRNRIGVQLEALRYALASTATPARMTSFQVEPSLLYSLPDRITDYVWLRPYLGSGATLRRYSSGSGTQA